MKQFLARSASAIAAIALAACGSGGSVIPTQPSATSPDALAFAQAWARANAIRPMPPRVTSASQVRAVCPQLPGRMRCFALLRTDVGGGNVLAYHGTDLARAFGPQSLGGGYTAKELETAYRLPSATRGKGQTVAVIDAFGYKNAAADLAVYRQGMGLPPCTVASGCLRIVNQRGQTKPLPKEAPVDDDWRPEAALDVDMVSAICPNCKIIMVQAQSDAGNGLYYSVSAAARLGANAISNSYGGGEGPNGIYGERSDPAFVHKGVAITASAGDSGYYDCAPGSTCDGAEQPCTLPTVVCVGGSTLLADRSVRGYHETVWNTMKINFCGGNCGATGSGCSAVVPKPAWQTDRGCRMRSAADVSAVASVNTPVDIYTTAEGMGWSAIGGTSASSPIVASVFALAGNARRINAPQRLWHSGRYDARGFFDVTIGDNVTGLGSTKHLCTKTDHYICYARKGYDGPTGWGTPNGISAF